MSLVKVKFRRDHKGDPIKSKVIVSEPNGLTQVYRPSDEPFVVDRSRVAGYINQSLEVIEEVESVSQPSSRPAPIFE